MSDSGHSATGYFGHIVLFYRLWVILQALWKEVLLHLWPTVCEQHCTFCDVAVLLHLFLWLKGCEWHCTWCKKQSPHIFSYDQQDVSDIAHLAQGSLITSFPMTNRLWVTLHILLKVVSSHLFLVTNRKWVTLHICERQSHHIFPYDQQEVSGHCTFCKGSLFTSFPITNSM